MEAPGIMGMLNMTNGESLFRLVPTTKSCFSRTMCSAYLNCFLLDSIVCQHCKKRLAIFPSPAGMSLTKLSPAGNNLIIPGRGEFGLGTGKSLTFFTVRIFRVIWLFQSSPSCSKFPKKLVTYTSFSKGLGHEIEFKYLDKNVQFWV